MLKTRTCWGTLLIAAFALVAGVKNARADVMTYDVVTPNSDLTGYTEPFVQVTVNLVNSTHATITFDSLTNGGYTYLLTGAPGTGAPAAFANISGNFSLASYSGTLYSGSSNALSNGGSQSINGFGAFDQSVKVKDNLLADSYTEIVMQVTATGTNTWAHAANVLTSNSDQQFLEARDH
jgi:hypothetical protein